MPVTQQDIADKVGVTRATVSMALRNAPKISLARREEIQQAARELGYQPNALVSTLMTHLRQSKQPPLHTGLLYLVSGKHPLPWPEDSTPDLNLKGAQRQAATHGFRLEPIWIHEPGLKSDRIAKIIKSRQIPGVVIGPKENELSLPELPWEELSTVMISQSFQSPAFDRVLTNFHASIHIALEIIKSQKSSTVRLILPTKHDRNVQHAWTAYYLFESQNKRRFEPPLLVENETQAVEWVRNNRGCTVLATNLILDWLENAGLQPQKDFKFVSLNVENRQDLNGIAEPGLAIGATAADRVISRIQLNTKGIPHHPQTILLEPSWQDAK